MANNIVIRTARKDYVCDCCGHKISIGTEYLDKVILNNDKCVQHTRYHDECPKVSKLIKAIAENNSKVPVTNNGTKYWLVGIQYDSVKKQAVIEEWDNGTRIFVDEDTFNKEWNYD